MYPFDKRLSLKGSVDVPRARISMPETTAPVVNTSSDVRIVRQGQDPLAIYVRQNRGISVQISR